MKYDIEKLSSLVHDAWWEEKGKQGFHSPFDCPMNLPRILPRKFEKACSQCHADMYPYGELPENIKDYDRAAVRAVLAAIEKIESEERNG